MPKCCFKGEGLVLWVERYGRMMGDGEWVGR